jgi:formiminoglutamase
MKQSLKSRWQSHYSKPSPAYWQTRKDSALPERYGQAVRLLDLSTASFPADDRLAYVIVGFACDTGVKRNLGRVGAAAGPYALRSALAKLAVQVPDLCVMDVGDIVCLDEDLEAAQQALGALVCDILVQGHIPMVFGGGHETAFGHYLGIAQTQYVDSLGIVNIDAHFDLRPLKEGRWGTSGTAFTQIAAARAFEGQAFSYCCIGIQPSANTLSVYDEAAIQDVLYLETKSFDCEEAFDTFCEAFEAFVNEHDHIYLSICLDAFAEAYAPGVSAPQPLGLRPDQIFPFLETLASSGKVIGLDIVELAPALDWDQQTARLGAFVLAQYLIDANRSLV